MGGLLDVFYPPACLGCAEVLPGDGRFCEECALGLEPVTLACPKCGEPGELGICERCRARRPPFTRAHAPFIHTGPIARAVHQFKYEDHPELAASLAALVGEAAADFLDEAPEWLCAIPLHARRLRERKYDQAHLFTERLARETGKRPLRRVLERIRETRRQVGLSESDRELNVAGAFRARGVEGARVLLVDDVLTTGATARAATHALLEAGAVEVQVLAIARASSWTDGAMVSAESRQAAP